MRYERGAGAGALGKCFLPLQPGSRLSSPIANTAGNKRALRTYWFSVAGGIELGLKWQAEVDGLVTGLRFYKGATNTGTHIGNLRTSTGTLLGTVTFSGETTSGWQQIALPTPVAVLANTTYVASYHTTTGHFSVTPNAFVTAVDAPPLHALANAASGGNGVFIESPTSAFPTQSFNASNYWVDVVFDTTTGPDTTPPTVGSVTPLAGATGVGVGANAVATFSERMNPATITASTVELRNASNALVPATVTYTDSTRTATLDPNAPLANSATYTATVKGGAAGVKDLAGNTSSPSNPFTLQTDATQLAHCVNADGMEPAGTHLTDVAKGGEVFALGCWRRRGWQSAHSAMESNMWSVLRHRHLTYGRHRGRAPSESRPQELVDRVHVVRFHDVEQGVLRVRPVPPDELESRNVGVEQRVRPTFIPRTRLGSVNLCDVKEHSASSSKMNAPAVTNRREVTHPSTGTPPTPPTVGSARLPSTPSTGPFGWEFRDP